jgi:RNA polymerase sigma-70 factor (ECF subfamily)
VARDQAGFTAFYERSSPALIRQVYAMCGDLPEAQDCVQEAYAKAWQRWEGISAYEAPEAWVRQVAWRLAVSRFRRARRGTGLLTAQRVPDAVPEISSDHVALVAALRQIPEAQRRALVLHHVAGRSVEEIAQETESPAGTVKARLSRGRAALAQLLSDDYEGVHRG